jgi:tetratricopeptide (TPR) repeat protein
MRKLFTLIIVLIQWASVVSAVQTTGKMPITTSSEKAKQYYQKGLDFSDKLRGFDSLEYFHKAATEDPQMALAFLNLAINAPTNKEFFENLDRAASLSAKASDGERMWIEAVKAGGSGQQARQIEIYQKLVTAYPNDERAHFLLGGSFFGVQDWNHAIVEYEKSVAINPKFSPPYNQMGYAYRFLEKYPQAEKSFKTYIELIPDDPNPYDSYAELLMRIGRFDESITQYKKALEVDPHFINSKWGIAANYNFKGEYDKAVDELNTTLNSSRNDGERRATLFSLSVSYASKQDWDKAVEQQQDSYNVAKKTNDVGAMAADLFVMGTILVESGKADEAKEKFDLSEKLVADSNLSNDVKENAQRNHLFNLATVALGKNDLASAKKLLAEFSKVANAAKSRFQIWQSHELAGRIALAEKNYKLALAELNQSNLQNPENLYRIAQVLEASGDQAKAKEMYKKVADFNVLNSLNCAFVQTDAKKKV